MSPGSASSQQGSPANHSVEQIMHQQSHGLNHAPSHGSSVAAPSPTGMRNEHYHSRSSDMMTSKSFNLAPGSRASAQQTMDRRSVSPPPGVGSMDHFNHSNHGNNAGNNSSGLNPNAQSYAPELLLGPGTSPSGQRIRNNSAMQQPSAPQQQPPIGTAGAAPGSGSNPGASGRPLVPFESLPNPQLQMQMRAAILAAGASLQIQTMQAQAQQQARLQQQQQQAAAAAAFMPPEFQPPSAETLRLLQTAITLNSSAAAAPPAPPLAPTSTMVQPSPVTSAVQPPVSPFQPSSSYSWSQQSQQSVTQAVPQPIGPPGSRSAIGRKSMQQQDLESQQQQQHQEDVSKSFPRPIGTERAQKKNPLSMPPSLVAHNQQQQQAHHHQQQQQHQQHEASMQMQMTGHSMGQPTHGMHNSSSFGLGSSGDLWDPLSIYAGSSSGHGLGHSVGSGGSMMSNAEADCWLNTQFAAVTPPGTSGPGSDGNATLNLLHSSFSNRSTFDHLMDPSLAPGGPIDHHPFSVSLTSVSSSHFFADLVFSVSLS